MTMYTRRLRAIFDGCETWQEKLYICCQCMSRRPAYPSHSNTF
jgi:hypothetical protein